ncbi:hypothetical protein I6E68_04290 [Salinibacterium sp. NSLL150]|uniref:hypothetical protein n=1 Tax=unclassified Salinibacterium TaxID=2632331 RepID=UPI0018CE8649|nr:MULTISPECIES: hypothetical protein [unclassified Salinibacterium]MBH0098360.1 hypothetical protein [Salinibacterium sp. NSLL35]MBH0101115.1 hypothetical protein [Salinibacterium sp. NSLL150]MBH0106635.1 hypothetical protein [Salinibacterium sp. NSLL17]
MNPKPAFSAVTTASGFPLSAVVGAVLPEMCTVIPTALSRSSFSALRSGFAAVVALALFVPALGVALPASAAPVTVTTEAELQSAIAAANTQVGADVINIGADILDVDVLLDVDDELTINLNGYSVGSVRVRAAADLTLEGPGSWTAGIDYGGNSADERDGDLNAAPGLGVREGSTLTISSLTVHAYGTFCDAAIGGWNTSAVLVCASTTIVEPGSIVIVGSDVYARGGSSASGIGGGAFSQSSTVSITGSVVEVSEGIGSQDRFGETGPNVLTVQNSTLINAVIEQTAVFDSGTVRFQGRSEIRQPLRNEGTIEVDPAGTLRVTAAVTNNAIIRPSTLVTNVGDMISGNSYRIIADVNAVAPAAPATTVLTAYAPTLAAAGEEFPAVSNGQLVVSGWNTAPDGSGVTVTTSTALSTLADASGDLVVYPQWVDPVLTMAPLLAAVTAGDSRSFTLDASGTEQTAAATFVSSNTSDVISGNVITATEVGTRTITARYGTFAVSTELSVEAAEFGALTVTPSVADVDQDGSVTLTIAGFDAYGNPVMVDASAAVVTSSVATDVIDGLTVTFPHASPHTLTVTLGAISGSTTINVIPAATTAAAGLAYTGSDSGAAGQLMWLALALVLAGLALVAARVVAGRA